MEKHAKTKIGGNEDLQLPASDEVKREDFHSRDKYTKHGLRGKRKDGTRASKVAW